MKKLPETFTLRKGKLILRSPKLEDAELVFSASRVPGFTDGMLWDPPTEIGEVEDSIRRSMEKWGERGYDFTILDRSLHRPIGRISIRETDREQVLNIGFWTHPKFQGRGYMSKTVAVMLDFAFSYLHAHSVEACFATWNVASKRVLEKNGFIYKAFLEKGFKKKGKWVEEILMEKHPDHL